MKKRVYFRLFIFSFLLCIGYIGRQSAANAAANDTKATIYYNVLDFGAEGNGKTLNTISIQQAIDHCHKNGGGTVLIPPGIFLSGTIYLKSHVTLRLESNATLLGSTDLKDYPDDTEGIIYPLFSRCLIFARDAEKISLEGKGTIDGQGALFSGPRPMLMRLYECREVSIRDMTFKNAASWCIHTVKCNNMIIDGITINSRVKPNSDGIDCDGCSNVIISNCHISSGDDAIALKTYEPEYPCKNIVITNCILSSRWAAFRFGPESAGNFENIAVSNCVIYDTYGNGIKLQMNEGAAMKNIVFSNLVMENVTGPISMRLAGFKGWLGHREESLPTGVFHDVQFNNIRATVAETSKPEPYQRGGKPFEGEQRSCISMTGLPGHPIRGITFSDIRITYPGGGTMEEADRRVIPDLPDEYPEYFMFGVLPAYGLYMHYAEDIKLDNVYFNLISPDLRPAIVCDDVNGLELSDFRAKGNLDAESLIRLQKVQDVFIHGCKPFGNTKTFLRIEGKESRHIALSGNDLRNVERIISKDESVTAKSIIELHNVH